MASRLPLLAAAMLALAAVTVTPLFLSPGDGAAVHDPLTRADAPDPKAGAGESSPLLSPWGSGDPLGRDVARRTAISPRPEHRASEREEQRGHAFPAGDGVALEMQGGPITPVGPKGDLTVNPPYRPFVARGQALQFILESDAPSPSRVLSSTEIGGCEPPSDSRVTHTMRGCIFHDLAVGEYSVKVTLLQKNTRGRWLPTSRRFEGSARVVRGQTNACAWRQD